MNEAIKKFIGKECIITTMNESVTGMVESIEDNWISVTSAKSKAEIINIDYISHIKEYPKNEKGKKKLIVS